MTLANKMSIRRPLDAHAARLYAAIVSLCLAIPSSISSSITLGMLLGLPFIGTGARLMWRLRVGRLLLIALALAVPSGIAVSFASSAADPGRHVDAQWAVYQSAVIVGLAVGTLVAVGVAHKLGPGPFITLLALSMSAEVIAFTTPDNPWKYGFALPVSLLIVITVGRTRIGLIASGIAIAALSVSGSYRSWLAIMATALGLALLSRKRELSRSPARLALLASALLVGGWLLASALVTLATSGFLGAYVQRRTTQQETIADNLFLGARPEWGAAIASFMHEPFGFGLGVTPSSTDYYRAISHMPFVSAQLQETSTVADYFKSGNIAFHSIMWTFWANYGVAGILTIVLVIWILGSAILITVLTEHRPHLIAASCLLLISGLWDTLFSPLLIPSLAAAVAVGVHYISPIAKPEVEKYA